MFNQILISKHWPIVCSLMTAWLIVLESQTQGCSAYLEDGFFGLFVNISFDHRLQGVKALLLLDGHE